MNEMSDRMSFLQNTASQSSKRSWRRTT